MHESRLQSYAHYNFRNFEADSPVTIECRGMVFNNSQITKDFRLMGRLRDPARAFITVESSTDSSHEFIGQTIGLASETLFAPPSRPTEQWPVVFQKMVTEDGGFAYYDPADIDNAGYQGCAPQDKIQRLFARYAHILVDETLLF